MTKQRRAIGIVRVSQVKGRDGESFASPSEQRERIEAACERDGLALVDVLDELDVSGGTPLAERTGLRSAVERIEAGEASVIVAAYFDRLCRSLRVQDELVSRVEKAGGQVLAVDVGRVTGDTAGQWLSGTMLGAVSEYQRRTSAERSAEAQRRAVERGVLPYPNVPPGYRRGPDGVLEPDPATAPILARAFAKRADGATIKTVREYLKAHGVERTYHGVQHLLKSRVMVGEIRFGELVNLTAHEPIVDRGVFQRVQEMSEKRGRRPSSDRLLARLGVLRCGSCGARMVVGVQTSKGRRYPFYRCPPTGDCQRRVTISAPTVEAAVIERVQDILAGMEGRATAKANRVAAEESLDRAERELAGAIRTLADFSDESATREKLEDLRRERDDARACLAEFGSEPAALTVSADDWDVLAADGRRGLVRATIESVTVAPGRGGSDRGAERITITDA